MINADDVKFLLSNIESDRVERTVSTTNSDKISQAICAFSNDLSGSGEPGYLIIGANDDGTLCGLSVTDELMLNVSSVRSDGNILPQPAMTVSKVNLPEGTILVVEVQPSEFPPVRYRGRIWIRVGPRKAFANEAEEKILIERRTSNAKTFDTLPCVGATLDDMDTEIFQQYYLPKAIPEEVITEDSRTVKEQLTSLGFFDYRFNCPTNAGIILFGKTPERILHGAYIQYVKFQGNEMAGEIVNEYKFSGNLCSVLTKLDHFIDTSIVSKHPVPVSPLREETVYNYPYWATRELLMNAIMHRDYETNAPSRFYEFDNRIEIQNPGNLYGKARPENFPNVNDYRNPVIAEAMKILGFVNRFSRGIARVQKELTANGNGEAIFDLTLLTAFKVTEQISRKAEEIRFGRNYGTGSTHVANEPVYEPVNEPVNEPANEPANETKILSSGIFKFIREKPGIGRNELSKISQKSLATIKRDIKKLVDLNLIERRGSDKTGGYFPKE